MELFFFLPMPWQGRRLHIYIFQRFIYSSCQYCCVAEVLMNPLQQVNSVAFGLAICSHTFFGGMLTFFPLVESSVSIIYCFDGGFFFGGG